jgi:chromosome segregation ATPase
MPIEELRTLVAEKESELDSCRKSRNKHQVEYASLQTYYDVTKEQIRELDMKIEKIDLDIENALEDNDTELKVYKQKSKFIQYCHNNKIKTSQEEEHLKQQTYNDNQEKQMSELEATKENMMAQLNRIETNQAEEIKSLQLEINQELANVRQSLDLEVSRFQQDCEQQHSQLKEELETKRKAELEIVTSRKESHLQDLMQSHEKTCQEMREYFDDIERQQEIEIEELQMEIRRLKKAAANQSSTKERLEVSNADGSKDLNVCSQQVRAQSLLKVC